MFGLSVKLGGGLRGAPCMNGDGGNGMCCAKRDGAGWMSGNCRCGAQSSCATELVNNIIPSCKIATIRPSCAGGLLQPQSMRAKMDAA